MSQTYVQCPTTKKWVPKGTIPADVNSPMIMKPMQEFISPIDKTVISSRSQLAAHNKRHGVTNAADYNGGYIERKALERINAGQADLKKTRILDIKKAIHKHS